MSNDPLSNYINESFKQIADAWNDSLEQAKRQRECKMRRFSYVSGTLRTLHEGVVFPDSQVVVQDLNTKAISVFCDLDAYTDHYRASNIRWIDPEPTA